MLRIILLILPGSVGFDMIFVYAAFYLTEQMHQDHFALILMGQMSFAVLLGIPFAIYPATMVEILPREVRCSGVSIAYNVCLGLFGGTAPLVATYLVQRTANDFAPTYYLMAVAAISLIVVVKMPDTARKPLP